MSDQLHSFKVSLDFWGRRVVVFSEDVFIGMPFAASSLVINSKPLNESAISVVFMVSLKSGAEVVCYPGIFTIQMSKGIPIYSQNGMHLFNFSLSQRTGETALLKSSALLNKCLLVA